MNFNTLPTNVVDGALISGKFKFITGPQSGTGLWWGPEYPNSTVKPKPNDPGTHEHLTAYG